MVGEPPTLGGNADAQSSSSARGRGPRFYQRILQLARRNPALVAGDFWEVETSAPDDVIAYRRGNGNTVILPAHGATVLGRRGG